MATDPNAPTVRNYPPLETWLHAIGARCLDWTFPRAIEGAEDDPPRCAIETWQANGTVFMVVIHANRNGWEIFTPGQSNDIKATFADVEARLGIDRTGKPIGWSAEGKG